jgi:hypothetical protein
MGDNSKENYYALVAKIRYLFAYFVDGGRAFSLNVALFRAIEPFAKPAKYEDPIGLFSLTVDDSVHTVQFASQSDFTVLSALLEAVRRIRLLSGNTELFKEDVQTLLDNPVSICYGESRPFRFRKVPLGTTAVMFDFIEWLRFEETKCAGADLRKLVGNWACESQFGCVPSQPFLVQDWMDTEMVAARQTLILKDAADYTYASALRVLEENTNEVRWSPKGE